MKQFTKEQMDGLAAYDGERKPFSTVLDSGYARNLASADYAFLKECWDYATGIEHHVNTSCTRCCFELIEAVGRMYRKQLAETPKGEPKEETPKAPTKRYDKRKKK